MSIEGGTKLSCQIAKKLSELPYRYSKMSRWKGHYRSHNISHSDKFEIEYKVGQKVDQKTEFDEWLTEKDALFQENNDSINVYEVHHVEWPMYKLKLERLNVNYPRFNTLLNSSPDLVHYSTGVQVVAWDKKTFR